MEDDLKQKTLKKRSKKGRQPQNKMVDELINLIGCGTVIEGEATNQSPRTS